MPNKDQLIIEVKGTRIEIPLHLVQIQIQKGWGENNEIPELIIKAIGLNTEETERWAKTYAKLAWK